MPIAAAVAVRKNIAKPIPKTICMGCPLTIMRAGEKAVVEAGEATEQQSFLLALSAVSGRRILWVVRKALHKSVNQSWQTVIRSAARMAVWLTGYVT